MNTTRLCLPVLLGLGLAIGAAGAGAPDLAQVAAGLLPADGVQKLAAGKWFPNGTTGCQFRLADPPSSFAQLFVATQVEGLSELDCPGYRVIGLYKKGVLLGPAALLDKASGSISAGRSWTGGALEGPGVLLTADGRRHEGSFESGRLEGPVLITAPDGSTQRGSMAAGQLAPGELKSFDPAGQLVEVATIGTGSQRTYLKRYENGQLILEVPLVQGQRQGLGQSYRPDAQGRLQKHTTLWRQDKVLYESPALALITGSPCPPLETPFGRFRPLADSCSEAALATALPPTPPEPTEAPAEAAPEVAAASPAATTIAAPAAPAAPAAAPVEAATAAPPASPEAPAEAEIAVAPPAPEPVREHPFEAYSEDGLDHLTGLLRNGLLVPREIVLDGGARRYESRSMNEHFEGEARYFEGSEMVYEGPIKGGRYDGQGLCRYNGSLERCEHAYGERVDTLYKTRLELQAYKGRQAEEAERLAQQHRQELAAERQRIAQLQASQPAPTQASGFQWGKLAALGVGAVAGGLTQLPSETQAKVIAGLVSDSMAGQEGLSNTQQAVQSAAPAGDAPATGTIAKPPKQATTYNASCPGTGRAISIPISYRTQACLVAAQEFALAYSCNDADSFARVTQGCVSACGSAQCAEP